MKRLKSIWLLIIILAQKAEDLIYKLEDLIKGADFAHSVIEAGGKVYIHCRLGLGRGPTMAIAYLLRMGATYEDAFATVQRARSFIHPRPVQVQRLKELEAYFRQHDKTDKKLAPRV